MFNCFIVGDGKRIGKRRFVIDGELERDEKQQPMVEACQKEQSFSTVDCYEIWRQSWGITIGGFLPFTILMANWNDQWWLAIFIWVRFFYNHE